MLKDLLTRLLVGELSRYGRDPQGNLVISPATLEEVAAKIAETAHKSIQRPVVTVSRPEILKLASRAGFKVVPTKQNGLSTYMLLDRTGAVEHEEVVSRLVDFTIQMVLERVAQQTKVGG